MFSVEHDHRVQMRWGGGGGGEQQDFCLVAKQAVDFPQVLASVI